MLSWYSIFHFLFCSVRTWREVVALRKFPKDYDVMESSSMRLIVLLLKIFAKNDKIEQSMTIGGHYEFYKR